MGYSRYDPAMHSRAAWNAGKTPGTKRPLNQKQIWAIRFHLARKGNISAFHNAVPFRRQDLMPEACRSAQMNELPVLRNAQAPLSVCDWVLLRLAAGRQSPQLPTFATISDTHPF